MTRFGQKREQTQSFTLNLKRSCIHEAGSKRTSVNKYVNQQNPLSALKVIKHTLQIKLNPLWLLHISLSDLNRFVFSWKKNKTCHIHMRALQLSIKTHSIKSRNRRLNNVTAGLKPTSRKGCSDTTFLLSPALHGEGHHC